MEQATQKNKQAERRDASVRHSRMLFDYVLHLILPFRIVQTNSVQKKKKKKNRKTADTQFFTVHEKQQRPRQPK